MFSIDTLTVTSSSHTPSALPTCNSLREKGTEVTVMKGARPAASLSGVNRPVTLVARRVGV